MKAALVRSLDDIEVVEMPVPAIGPGEILVEMKAVGLCGSDLAPWYVEAKAPTVLGHEPAGVVAAVGAGVTAFRPGDRVFVHHHAACGRCRFCEAGEPVMCADWKPNRLHPGGLAEFFRAEAATVATDTFLIPDGLTFEDASLVEPVACALKAVDRAAVRPRRHRSRRRPRRERHPSRAPRARRGGRPADRKRPGPGPACGRPEVRL